MAQLILINGCGGAGKETTGQLLFESFQHASLLDIKGLSRTAPWNFDQFELGLKNAASVIRNYLEAGFPRVIFSGGVTSQAHLDLLTALLPADLSLLYVWLDVPKQIRDLRRVERKRDEGDKAGSLDYIDSVFTDPGVLRVARGEYLRIDAGQLTRAKVVDSIKTKVF